MPEPTLPSLEDFSNGILPSMEDFTNAQNPSKSADPVIISTASGDEQNPGLESLEEFSRNTNTKSKKLTSIETSPEVDATLPSLDEFSHKQDVQKLRQSRNYKQVVISGGDIIHHLGIDPSIVDKLNPSVRAKLISEVAKARTEDDRKRAEGQKEFPIDSNYQNSMRKKIGIPQMKTIMEQYTAPKEVASDGLYTNHNQFPIIYNIASQIKPEIQDNSRNSLIVAAKRDIQEEERTRLSNFTEVPTSRGDRPLSDSEIEKLAEGRTDQYLAAEEQRSLDKKSSTAQWVSDFLHLSRTQEFGGTTLENINRGFTRSVVGGTLKQLGNIQSLSPFNFGVADWTQRIGREIQAGTEINSGENKPTTIAGQLRRGIEEGIGASPEILKLYAGAEILKAAELPELLNLPIQGAISRADEGIPGVIKGASGGFIYHYGGEVTGQLFANPYLAKIGNSLIWVAGPAAEAHLIGGQDLATAIGENIPMGLFIGATSQGRNGAERVTVTDGTNIKSATTEDLAEVKKGTLQLVPPSYRVSIQLTPPPIFGKFGILENQRGIVGGTYVPSYESPENKYGENTTQIEPNLETGFQARGEGQTIKLSLERAALNWLDLGRAIENKEITNPQDNLQEGLTKQQAAANALEVLNKQLPDEIKDFVTKNEDAIRTNLKKNAELDAKRAEVILLRTKESTIAPEKQTEMDKTIGNTGAFNRNEFVNREQAYDANQEVMNLLTRKVIIRPGKQAGGYVDVGQVAKVFKEKSVELAKLVSFHIEDLYHRGMDADYSTIMNRLKVQMPAIYNSMNEEQKHQWFNLGTNYWQSNNADPFFSTMKMDATEKLPSKNIDPTHAKNVLSQHKNEWNWTVGLREFLTDKEVRREKFSKKELIDIIQKGQVRVETSVAEDLSGSARHEGLIKERSDLYTKLAQIANDKFVGDHLAAENGDAFYRSYQTKLDRVNNEIVELVNNKTKYSLKAYSGEKLELPGAVNSKEVKLISPIIKNEKMANVLESIGGKSEIKYQAPHWDEPNVVAHYRSNDRTTTDGINIHFSEEFQSDWNHDIRQQGVKLFSGTEHDANRVEPNPFMSHNWKELILKRFIRDSVVAKDENGNYKYDGIGWTTARQQKERYGKVLEGKDFQWYKNSDGTYNFKFKDDRQVQGAEWTSPHELSNISLEKFAELTTKEAAEEVRDQESQILKNYKQANADPSLDLKGKFSLKEAIELRSGIGKYSDYDVALVNIAKKIGKRFGASYSQKEIHTKVDINKAYNSRVTNSGDSNLTNGSQKIEKVHFLEITPSMRASLSKEGLPLYGLGTPELLKLQEQGVRNRITTTEVFDEAKNNLVDAISSDKNLITPTEEKGTILNSGLSPEAFLDQAKLLYKGIKEFSTFSKELLARFGDVIKPYLKDIWFHVQELHQDERGFLNLTKIDPRNVGLDAPAAKDYLTNDEKHQSKLDMRFTHRMIYLAQLDPKFAQTYDVMRKGQRVVNHFQSNGLTDLQSANASIKNENHNQVGQVLYTGLVNENRVIPRAELLTGGTRRPALSTNQADAYEKFYEVQHRNLDIRLQTILYGFRDRALKLNADLNAAVPGSPEAADILSRMGDMSDKIDKIKDYYKLLKDSGYFSLQRTGPIAAYIEDATGSPIYQQFEGHPIGNLLYKQGLRKANNWIKEQIANGANPTTQNIYDIRKIEDLGGLTSKLSPVAFEDLVDQSGISPNSPDIEKLRDKVYSQFPTMGYQLKRDFVGGYETTWESALASTVNQLEKYSSSFYSRVSGNEAMKALVASGISKTDPNLHTIAKSYIEDEISSPESTFVLNSITNARRVVSFIQLGYDFNQFYMNAIAQPTTQTYNYFARVENPNTTGDKLTGLEPEKYFKDASILAGKTLRNDLGMGGAVNPEFKQIYDRLTKERVLAPEFTRSLLDVETKGLGAGLGKSTLQKATSVQQHEHWASIFMRAGEKTTRTHVAAEAYLVGKNKFKLEDEQLVDFIVRAVDATQSNPTKGENPYIIRRALGNSAASREAGKLVYQFGTFNHMWLENLGLNIRADFKNKNLAATSRMLYPLAIMGGVKGMPLAAAALALYTAISGDDPKKKFDHAMGKDSILENLVLNGITTSSALGNKLTPSFPLLDTTNFMGDNRSNIPVVSTYQQFQQGVSDLLTKNNKLRGFGEVMPRAIRGPLNAARLYDEGARNRDRTTVIPKSQITIPQLIGQGINITPNKIITAAEKKKTERLIGIHRKIFGR